MGTDGFGCRERRSGTPEADSRCQCSRSAAGGTGGLQTSAQHEMPPGHGRRALRVPGALAVPDDPQRRLVIDGGDPMAIQILQNPSVGVVGHARPDHRPRAHPPIRQCTSRFRALTQQRAVLADLDGSTPGVGRADVQIPVVGALRTGRSPRARGRKCGGGRRITRRRMQSRYGCGCFESGHSRLRGCRGHATGRACPWKGRHRGRSTVPGTGETRRTRTLTHYSSNRNRLCRQLTVH